MRRGLCDIVDVILRSHQSAIKSDCIKTCHLPPASCVSWPQSHKSVFNRAAEGHFIGATGCLFSQLGDDHLRIMNKY